ncbi:D-isomer specific 2-hydroxyacid dehydrogenase, catalytic domain [Lentibacillus halodurans]|uniref:D-isomer specific 2-hydroxyacid dehydrogenase, catalytic domain n=1 Tax=Lentibacillus halodurans TaxID=237679 RepID=A0A1I1AI59_9BACI|nr:D-2-hydroxyacid dehydrogenase family protein [Lentibacillus halodurans]SFB37709.1 D-isomer specific 2-hydroxyacid dehydrogenase, catalytic domain [Lentibacillus halodurans]
MKTVILDDWEKYMTNHPSLERLQAFSNVAVYTDKPSFDELVDRLHDVDAVLPIRERTQFNKELIECLPDLKLIAQTGTGVAHLDMEALNQAGIPVARTPGGSTAAVTELTFAYMLNLIKKVAETDRAMRNNAWPEIIGTNLRGKSLGIIGLGKIGCSVAKMAKAFGMNVMAWGPTLTEQRASKEGVQYTSLHNLLRLSDAVSLHVRLVPETTNLLQEEHFALMKPSAVLINTSRGRVVKEQALMQALQNKEIAGAGLDVFEKEPLPVDHPFRSIDNTLITSHIGWKTEETFNNFLNGSIDNVHQYFVKNEPRNIFNREVLEE